MFTFGSSQKAYLAFNTMIHNKQKGTPELLDLQELGENHPHFPAFHLFIM